MIDSVPSWDQHIRIVFSVLVSVSLAQSFEFINREGYSTQGVLLFCLAFYVVLDNWYHLHRDLRIIDVEKPAEITLYLLALVVYACLPFLYGAGNTEVEQWGPSEWMVLNLALICGLDALRKTLTLFKLRSECEADPTKATNELKQLMGMYFFYVISGFAFAIGLGILLMVMTNSEWTSSSRVGIVLGLWASVRTIDLAVVPRLSNVLYKIII